jgi:uncharacterized protein YecE (DUF72 family)
MMHALPPTSPAGTPHLAAAAGGRVRIGISGWTYKPWRGVFYPEKLPQKHELAYAAGRLGSIEINGTFYSLQRPESFANWAAQTPDDFMFSVKAPRYLTHIRRLKEIAPYLANFFASGLLRLGPKLGPLLWQLPPSFPFRAERLQSFFAALPRSTTEAAALARNHDARLKSAFTETDAERPLRHALEIRHASFVVPEFIALLRAHDIALVCADSVAWPRLMDVTANFVYCRLHGSEELYASGYDDAALDAWADRVVAWAAGGEPADAERVIDAAAPPALSRDVFVYFDNDAKVRAPFDALGLISRVEHLLARHPGAVTTAAPG